METVCAVILVLLATAFVSPSKDKGVLENYTRGSSSPFGNGVQGTTAEKRREDGKAFSSKTLKRETHPMTEETPFLSKTKEEINAGEPRGKKRHPTVSRSQGDIPRHGTRYNPFRETTTPRDDGFRNHSLRLRYEGGRNDLDGRLAPRGVPREGAPGAVGRGDGSNEDSGGAAADIPAERSPRSSRGRLVVKGRGRRSAQRPHPPSPCPGVFTYLRAGPSNSRWYGIAHVAVDETLVGVRLGIQLDKPAKLLGAWLGEVKTENKKDFTIWNREKTIEPNSPLPVKIMVQYDEKEIQPPRIKSIFLNGIQICPTKEGQSPQRHVSQQSQINRGSNQKPPSSNAGNQGSGDVELVDGVPCGRIDFRPTIRITNGQPTEKGDWPWHAAIYQSKKNNLTYICGGTVIRKKMVLTAAHCVSERHGRKDVPVAPHSLVVFLGKFHLEGWEEGIQAKEVEHVHVYHEYRSEKYTADIAILELSTPIEFNQDVKPVCLWDENRPHLSEIQGREGVVVGWGRDENGNLTENLMMANMPVVSQYDCILSYPEFFSFYTSDRTFCAGFRKGTTACRGDSGGGMFFPKKVPGKIDKLVSPLTWTIRGIVSLGVSLDTSKTCDPNNYVIFVDVAKFLHWIKQYH